ncbi:MAG: OFA family MFS transporter [Nitrososphaerales archaeon]
MNKWIYPPIGFVINIALGTIYSWSVFRVPLEKIFSWSSVESSLPFTVFLALFGLTMPFGGRAMSTIGPRKTALLGSILVGLGWVLAGFAGQVSWPLPYMLIAYGVVGGIGVGLVYGVPIAVSSRWIPERKGLATGITILGFGLSPLITAVTSAAMIQLYGVLQTFLYLGVIFAVILILLSLPLKFPPAQTPSTTTAAAAKGIDIQPRQMVKTRLFAGLWLSYVLGTTGGFIAISLAAKYGQEVLKLEPAIAAVATAVFAIFNGVGRPSFGYLCDKIGPYNSAWISFIIILASALVASSGATLPIYFATFALLWFTFGGWLAIAPAATSTYFGVKNIGANYGIVFTAYGVGAIVGPQVASYLYTTTGSYILVFTTTAVLAVIGLIVALTTLKRGS